MVRTFTAAEYAAYCAALPVEPLARPLFTNASINRKAATEALKHGKTPEQIAERWSEVFALVDGKLAQLYDYQFNDRTTFETLRQIASEDVAEWLHERAVCRHCDCRITRAKKGVRWRNLDGKVRCPGRSGATWSRHQPHY